MADGGGDNYLTCDETDSDDDSKELRENSDVDETDREDVSKELREDDDAENLRKIIKTFFSVVVSMEQMIVKLNFPGGFFTGL